ncbi:MAG: class I SAM-dependent methyltransferase [Leptospiraceae bacterium]|nr:class I SAM-dependent methyltransferase [Leptospiraceae bacterium]
MPTLDWLKKEFHYGYDSGNVLDFFPDKQRKSEEKVIGGSYRKVFYDSIGKYLNPESKVLELGPGKGSWTRAILKYIPNGELTTVDFQDLEKFLQPEKYNRRLKCIQIQDNTFMELPNDYFDVFWSFGVLCHNNQENIEIILRNALPKVKQNGYAIHQYADWEKLEKFGWGEKSNIPVEFQSKPDNEIWWPRNTKKDMQRIASASGWKVISIDLELVERDSICVLQKG